MRLGWLIAFVLVLQPAAPALARNILITNDDGLTSNVHALYLALKQQGHDVIVSVPCTNQSGMGAAIRFARPLGPLAQDCLNGAASAGAPGAGPMTRAGFEHDFYYVDGTPVMAMLYGVDVAAAQRWGGPPGLVLSGPNEGQNVGGIVLTSGTVSNAQWAAIRGLPAIALSASANTTGDAQLANPRSAEIARLAAELVQTLDQRAEGGPLLPHGVALNVNFPDELEGARWRPSRIGDYNSLQLRFTDDLANSPSPESVAAARARGIELPHLPGITAAMNTQTPRADQRDNEAVVYQHDIAVSVMEAGYDHQPSERRRLRGRLRSLFDAHE